VKLYICSEQSYDLLSAFQLDVGRVKKPIPLLTKQVEALDQRAEFLADFLFVVVWQTKLGNYFLIQFRHAMN